MDRTSFGDDAPTRRDYLRYGGALLGAGATAGCLGDGGGGQPPANGTDNGTDADSSYSVSMAPVGEVPFDGVPETWSTYFPGYADMGVALGVGDGLQAVGVTSRYHTEYYDDLDGVSIDTEGLTQLYDEGVDEELYFEIDADVHLTDPKWYTNNSFFGLGSDDLDQIRESVAPFLGNTIFRRTDPWHDYRYYTMYEAFETVAAVFRRRDRYEAFAAYHDEVLADLQASLPPADDRPSGLLCFAGSTEPESFSPYRLTDKGTNKKHFHDLGVEDALVGTGIDGLSTDERGKIDYETLLEVDPEMLFVRGHEDKTRAEFEDTVLAFMAEHSVAGDLTAVQNEDVYRGGPIYQGPIQNLFLTERFARLLYPDAVGDGELFDRDRVAAIVAGEE